MHYRLFSELTIAVVLFETILIRTFRTGNSIMVPWLTAKTDGLWPLVKAYNPTTWAN